MRILILSPLFPPDIGAPAPYSKILASKLTNHEVTLLVYGFLPESVPGINIVTADKRQSKISLLFSALLKLNKADHGKDLILINNGPSAELPALIYSFFTKTPVLLCISDGLAEKTSERGLYKYIHKLFLKRVVGTITLPADSNIYLPKEKLPFDEDKINSKEEHSGWWSSHLKEIESYAK